MKNKTTSSVVIWFAFPVENKKRLLPKVSVIRYPISPSGQMKSNTFTLFLPLGIQAEHHHSLYYHINLHYIKEISITGY